MERVVGRRWWVVEVVSVLTVVSGKVWLSPEPCGSEPCLFCSESLYVSYIVRCCFIFVLLLYISPISHFLHFLIAFLSFPNSFL